MIDKEVLKDIEDSYNNYKLCFIDSECRVAYFTPLELKEQWGDDWDDIPYEHNAGEPYEYIYDKDGNSKDIKIIKVKMEYEDNLLEFPCTNTLNSIYSVDMINEGKVSWIKGKNFEILAGISLLDFINKLEQYNVELQVEI